MKLLGLSLVTALFALCSCAETPEKKPVGPSSETSKIPWNTQVPGQGMGQFGMMPQNQYRR
ncbi:MAG: hypothetical protein KGQ87_03010 [Verrucomicrobia bacterium]|nr:hypothetical protein [Verrucomicrobiota bacterium]